MKYLSLYIIFSFLLSSPQLLVLYPDADLSNNTDKLNASDIETVYYLFVDGFRQYSEFDIVEQDERDNPDRTIRSEDGSGEEE